MIMGSRTGKQQASPYAEKPWLKHYDYWVPEQTNFARQPLSQMLNLAAAQFNDHPATVFLDARLTFGQLKERADKLATALARLGIRKGDRVGIMLPNCPQYLISFFAIVRLGAIVTNVNPIYTPREVELVAKDSGMRAMITLDSLSELILSVQPQTQIEHVITTRIGEYSAGGQAAPTPADTLSFSEMIASINAPELPHVEIDA